MTKEQEIKSSTPRGMTKKYRYIAIKPSAEFDGKPSYIILNNRSKNELGMLFWYKSWKQYVFTQSKQGIIFNDKCLLDIVDFISNLDTRDKLKKSL